MQGDRVKEQGAHTQQVGSSSIQGPAPWHKGRELSLTSAQMLNEREATGKGSGSCLENADTSGRATKGEEAGLLCSGTAAPAHWLLLSLSGEGRLTGTGLRELNTRDPALPDQWTRQPKVSLGVHTQSGVGPHAHTPALVRSAGEPKVQASIRQLNLLSPES